MADTELLMYNALPSETNLEFDKIMRARYIRSNNTLQLSYITSTVSCTSKQVPSLELAVHGVTDGGLLSLWLGLTAHGDR